MLLAVCSHRAGMNDDTENDDNKTQPKAASRIVKFPQSRTPPKQTKGGFKDLGLSRLTQKGGRLQPGLKGHWCSRCKGIWYGFVGECECPQCGNRNG